MQDALHEKTQETLSLEPLIQAITKKVDDLGSQPISLEKLHTGFMEADTQTTAGHASPQVMHGCSWM